MECGKSIIIQERICRTRKLCGVIIISPLEVTSSRLLFFFDTFTKARSLSHCKHNVIDRRVRGDGGVA